MFPPALRNAQPSPCKRSMMKPSPPKKPAPIFLLNAMPTLTPFAAQRKESSCAHERAKEAAVLLRAVAEDSFHLDAILHVHHAAGLGHGGFHRVQFDFDE